MTPVVHVVDDDDEMRASLSRMLRAEGYEVRTYASAGDFLLSPPPAGPGCVLLDLQMPGPNGLELQAALQRQPLPLPVVFVSGQGDISSTVQAMKAGAVDFLEKPVTPEALLKAVATALAARARHEDAANVQSRYARLSTREREVFEQVVAGRLNKQIADALGITERTVKMHRGQMMAKMQAGSVAELVRAAALVQR